MTRKLTVLLAAAVLGLAAGAQAAPTRVTVRVIAKGAKFIGTSIGGARVVLRDADTGAILASGVTSGSTGDTARIMKEPRARGGVLSSEGSAAYTAVLDIDRPVLVEADATGPLAARQSANRVTATQWVVPGKDLTGGDAWLLEMPGFMVDVLAPPTHSRAGNAPVSVPIAANVTMMCGCPLTPGGLWDADVIQVRALVSRDGVPVGEVPLAYAGTASQFAGTVNASEPGEYEVTVYAYDPRDGNTGLDHATFIIGKE